MVISEWMNEWMIQVHNSSMQRNNFFYLAILYLRWWCYCNNPRLVRKQACCPELVSFLTSLVIVPPTRLRHAAVFKVWAIPSDGRDGVFYFHICTMPKILTRQVDNAVGQGAAKIFCKRLISKSNSSGFAGHTISAATIQLRLCRTKAAIDNN